VINRIESLEVRCGSLGFFMDRNRPSRSRDIGGSKRPCWVVPDLGKSIYRCIISIKIEYVIAIDPVLLNRAQESQSVRPSLCCASGQGQESANLMAISVEARGVMFLHKLTCEWRRCMFATDALMRHK
jgi:hypothetical protein